MDRPTTPRGLDKATLEAVAAWLEEGFEVGNTTDDALRWLVMRLRGAAAAFDEVG